MQTLFDFLRSSYAGVNHAIPGNGGTACYDFLSPKQRLLDTSVFTLFALFVILPRVFKTISLPSDQEVLSLCRKKTSRSVTSWRRWFLIALCLVFGIEIGFKIIRQSWIYLLNPCHVITCIQIYLLSAEPSRKCTAVFRVHNHLLFGAFLASILPVTNTRISIAEKVSYWIHHLLITFVIPPYLMNLGGAYNREPIKDFSWPLLTIIIFGSYMYYVLQGFGVLTLVNVNNMLCPAISDPFYGPNYRWFAFVHQQLLIIIFGKVYTCVIQKLSELLVTRSHATEPIVVLKNGHAKMLDENENKSKCD